MRREKLVTGLPGGGRSQQCESGVPCNTNPSHPNRFCSPADLSPPHDGGPQDGTPSGGHGDAGLCPGAWGFFGQHQDVG